MGLPVVIGNTLYLLGHHFGRKDFIISRSEDGGQSWAPMVTLFRGEFWNAPTGYVITGGRIYRAFDSGRGDHGRPLYVACGDTGKDLLNPGSWRISNSLPYPGTPDALRRPGYYPEFFDHWLEPNVVQVKDRLMLLARARIARYSTAGMCGVCDIADDGTSLELKFTQFHPLPGGQNKFHILFDEPSPVVLDAVQPGY